MKTEQKLLTLTFSEQAQENYHVLRMVDDNGEELTWQMHGFITDLCPSMYFPTEEQYMEHVHQWEEIFEFPSWEDIAIPGVGACLAPWGADLTFKEIHQWLYDILFEMRSHLDGFEVENRILIDTGLSKDDDSMPFPSELTIALLLKKPQPVLDVIYMPEMPDFEDPMEGLKNTMLAYMSQGHEQIPICTSVPVIWNVTQNRPNVFSRGDICKVRFLNGGSGIKMTDHPEFMSSWETMPFSQVWKLWE